MKSLHETARGAWEETRRATRGDRGMAFAFLLLVFVSVVGAAVALLLLGTALVLLSWLGRAVVAGVVAAFAVLYRELVRDDS